LVFSWANVAKENSKNELNKSRFGLGLNNKNFIRK
jgi:hypothetical protein